MRAALISLCMGISWVAFWENPEGGRAGHVMRPSWRLSVGVLDELIYYSRLLNSLSAFVGKECYLRALFIHHESWRPWPLILELLLILAALGTADHSLLPEILYLASVMLFSFSLQLPCFFCLPCWILLSLVLASLTFECQWLSSLLPVSAHYLGDTPFQSFKYHLYGEDSHIIHIPRPYLSLVLHLLA